MFTRTLIGLSLAVSLLSLSATIAAPTDAGGLTAAQRRSLQSLGVKVAVPGYIPPGFQISQVVAQRCPTSVPRRGLCREGPYYTLVYQNAQKSCLVINGIGGGIGGPDPEYEFSTTTPLLGAVAIGFNLTTDSTTPQTRFSEPPSPAQLNTPQATLYSFPTRAKGGRSLYYNATASGSQYYRDTYGCAEKASLTPRDLEKVVQSFDWLK